MLILLPPSEGKTPPARGPRLRPDALSFPELRGTRSAVLERLIAVCAKDASAMKVLGLGPTQREEIVRNRSITTSPCGPAVDVYTGVLFEALDAETLTTPQRTRLNAHVAMGSALWGLVRPLDPIPAYRLSGDARLPVLGAVSTMWKEPVTAVLGASRGGILDLRSEAYRFGVLPDRADVAVGRVLLERGGRRSVVSHHNKATKGRAVRALAMSRARLRTLDDVMGVLEASGIRCELHDATRGPARLDLVTRDL